MKTSISFGVFALLIMGSFSSCNLLFGDLPPDAVDYTLALSFQDASGNDLVKGIGIEDHHLQPDDPYVLEIIESQACEDEIYEFNSHHGVRPEDWPDRFSMGLSDGYYFLASHNSHIYKSCLNEKMTTYKLECPYLFGDKEEHEIVVYWDLPKKREWDTEATCSHVEFEGKTYTPVTSDTYYKNKVIIVLDR